MIDWVQAKADYVNNPAITLQDIADKYGVPKGTVSAQASDHEWMRDRKKRNKLFQQKATEKSIINAAAELAAYNAEDLFLAKKLRKLIAKEISSGEKTAQDVRALAGAFESVQRVAHLALGAATELTGQVDNVDLTLLAEEEFASIESLYAKANRRGTQAAQC